MMMEFKQRQWLLMAVHMLCGVMMLTACSDSGDDAPEEQPDVPQVIPNEARTLVSVMKETSYLPEEFTKYLGAPSMVDLVSSLQLPMGNKISDFAVSLANVKLSAHLPHLDSLFAAEVGTESDGTRRWRFESYTFTYQSVTSYGESIEMSGRVTFPNNVVDGIGHEVSTLSLHSHQEFISPDCAPSENLMFMPMRAMYNSAVIEPDFQNYGINSAKVYDGSGSPKALARQLTDCVIAALEVMQQHGVTLAPNGHTTNWGSSKNVAVPLAFAKYYETEAPQWFRDAVRLGSTFVGEGNIDLGKVMPYYFQRPEAYSVGLFYMSTLSGLTASQLGGYAPKDIFSPWLNNTTVRIGDQDYTLLDAISLGLMKVIPADPRLPEITSLDQILAPDLLTPDGNFDASNPKAQAFLQGLTEESGVYGWEPALPIYMAHCPYDQAAPYSYSQQFYLQFSNQETNPAVHWMDVPFTDFLSNVAKTYKDGIISTHVIVAFFMYLYMSCVEEPADMFKLYRNPSVTSVK